jgi:putative membrane protein
MKNLINVSLLAAAICAVEACSLPKYEASTMTVPRTGVSTSSSDPTTVRPTDGTTRTGGTPTGANSGTSPFSAGMPSMGTANSTSSGISGEDFAAEDNRRVNTNFIRQAEVTETSLLALSQLASTKAQGGALKNLASMMTKDYQKANDELRTVAREKTISLPENNMDALTKLSAVPAKDFDRVYVEMMTFEHDKAIGLFKDASQYPDPIIKAYAGKYLSILRANRKQLKSIK